MKKEYYLPLVLIFVLTIFFTIYKNKDNDNDNIINTDDIDEIIVLSRGQTKSDNKIVIYGNNYLSEDNISDIKHEYYCQNVLCNFIGGNDNYAIINDNKITILSLKDNKKYYIPANIYNLYNSYLLVNNGVLYGILYNDLDHDIYYDINDNKYYFKDKNISIDYNSKYIIDKDELIIKENDISYLINYKNNEVLIMASSIEIEKESNDYIIIVKDYKDDIINTYNLNLDIINNYQN